MSDQVLVEGSSIIIRELEFKSDVVAHYLSGVAQPNRPQTLTKALEVGVYCLERVSATNDVDFFRSQIDRLLKDAIDPRNERSTLGQSLKEIRSLLDPKHLDSIPCVLERACGSLTKGDGELVKSVRGAVSDQVREIVRRIEVIDKQLDLDQQVDEVLSNTTAAGRPFEHLVLDKLGEWGQSTGAEIEHVGTDNRPGDVLVKVPKGALDSTKIPLIVEAKHNKTAAGRKQIGDSLRNAMETRQACAAVYVCHSTDGFAREINDWAEGHVNGRGPWVATTIENLTTAVRFVAAIVQLDELRHSQARLDTQFISRKMGVLKQSLQHFSNIQTKLTGIQNGVEYIRAESRSARDIINDAISEIEQALREGAGQSDGLLETAGAGASNAAGRPYASPQLNGSIASSCGAVAAHS